VASTVLRSALLLIANLATAGCGLGHPVPVAPSTLPPQSQPTANSKTPTAYLESLLTTMEAYAINKNIIEWASFRAQVIAAAGDAPAIPDLYPAIEIALRLLDDRESYYQPRSGGLIGLPPGGECRAVAPLTPALPDSIGYVKIEASGAGQSAESIHRAIRTADREGLVGWIVDLRGNGGGNMWPMIAGVGPIMGEGTIGWIVYNNREYEREYRNGAALSLGEAFASVDQPYTLRAPNPKVAVLTDGLVNSAGEAMAVWFRGRPQTRSFGTPTCGHHHLQQNFSLSDGATLYLTTAQNADRTKTKYQGPITPNEVLTEPGELVTRAVAWLQGRG
jgi:carboxyl-terminal processing protease